MHRVAVLLPAGCAALLAACGSSGPETTTNPTASAPARPLVTAASLPFQYQAVGESSSPSFHVATAGTYTVSWALTGSDQQPDCLVSIGLVSKEGQSQQVLAGTKVAPTDTPHGSVALQLTPGDWRFQEGGGCGWKVSVTAG